MKRIVIGTSVLMAAALLTGWTGEKALPETSHQEISTSQARATPSSQVAESQGPDLKQLQSTIAQAEQKRQAILGTMEKLGPEAEAFRETFKDNQSIALSAPELGVEFAGKDWIGRSDTKRMDIQIRLANPSKDKTIKSVVLGIDIYRQGSDVPVVKTSRWLATSFLGLEPLTAAVRSITPVSEDPFTRSELLELNDREIHLIVRPLEIRYWNERVALQINRPDQHLAELRTRQEAIEADIQSLEHELAQLEKRTRAGHEQQVASKGVIPAPSDG